MTEPSAATFRMLAAGWLLAPRRTIVEMRRVCGADRHHAAFHRLFASARWSIDQAGLAVFDLITTRMQTVFLAVDDTLLPRFGLQIFGTGMHRDPVLSSRGHAVTRWGHCWVVLCVIIESRHVPGRRFALPVLARLYLNKSSADKWRRAYRTKNQLLRDMLAVLQQHRGEGEKRLHLLEDSAFTAPAVLDQLPGAIAVTGFLLYSLIVWRHETARRSPARPLRRWRGKHAPSFADMLAALRQETLQNTKQTHFSTPALPAGVKKFINQLTDLVSLAS